MLMFVAKCEADVECNGKGTCNMDDGTCQCNADYHTDDCSSELNNILSIFLY